MQFLLLMARAADISSSNYARILILDNMLNLEIFSGILCFVCFKC